MRRLAPELLLTAKTQRWNPEEFLRTLLDAKLTSRDESNTRTRMKAAAFPVIRTIEFDVSASSIPQATFDYLASLERIRAAENYCAVGPAGTGKSHSLVAFGVAAVHTGHKVRYFTRRRPRRNPLPGPGRQLRRQTIETLLRNDLVIVDEVGFAPWDDTGANFCSGSLPPPTNAAPWPSALTGPSTNGAVSFPNPPPPPASWIGFCLHHSIVVITEGESFRMRQARTRTGGRLTTT